MYIKSYSLSHNSVGPNQTTKWLLSAVQEKCNFSYYSIVVAAPREGPRNLKLGNPVYFMKKRNITLTWKVILNVFHLLRNLIGLGDTLKIYTSTVSLKTLFL